MADDEKQVNQDQGDHSEAQNPNSEPQENNSQDSGSKKQSSGKGSKSSGKGPKVHPAEQERQDAEDNGHSPVQPIEVVRNKPEVDNEEAETVTAGNKPNLQEDGEQLQEIDDDPAAKPQKQSNSNSKDLCWNCSNHGKKNSLDKNGNCSECGFKKDDLYNLDLESRKAQEREAASYQY